MSNQKLKLAIATIAALSAEVFAPMFSGTVSAAPPPQFTQSYLRLDRMKELTATGGTICAQPRTTATEADFQITFPTQTGTDFVVNGTASNWTVTTSNLPAGSTAWPGINTATAVSGHTVTFPSNDLTVGTLYCFNFSGTNTLTNGSAGNSLTGFMHTRTAGAAVIDETNYAVALITDDQIVVSAVVPPTFVFALSGNTDTFPSNLDPASIKSTAGRTFSITTNAKGGWIAWAKDSQQGLFSASANYTIPTSGTVDGTPSTLATNSEGYVLDADMTTDAAGGCTVAIDAEYNGATTSAGGTLSANFQPVAACTGTAPATSNGDVITLIERASIAGGTPAGSDYTDTITVVAAGNF
ncbi:MAG TPA: hypothetical protein VI322_01790 [Candidatus Saccharimonadia bacterium]